MWKNVEEIQADEWLLSPFVAAILSVFDIKERRLIVFD